MSIRTTLVSLPPCARPGLPLLAVASRIDCMQIKLCRTAKALCTWSHEHCGDACFQLHLTQKIILHDDVPQEHDCSLLWSIICARLLSSVSLVLLRIRVLGRVRIHELALVVSIFAFLNPPMSKLASTPKYRCAISVPLSPWPVNIVITWLYSYVS
jgi:hypothetical protein